MKNSKLTAMNIGIVVKITLPTIPAGI